MIPKISIPISLSSGNEFFHRCLKLQAFLGPGIEDNCITVIAYSQCEGGSDFLQHWSGTLEAAWLINSLLRRIEGTSQPPLQVLSRLLVANLIYHYVLGTGNRTNYWARLPSHQSQWECYLIPQVLVSYAQHFGLQSELNALAPSSFLLAVEPFQNVAKWKELWDQRFPRNWRRYLPVSWGDPEKGIETLDDLGKSEVSHRSKGSSPLEWLWGCW